MAFSLSYVTSLWMLCGYLRFRTQIVRDQSRQESRHPTLYAKLEGRVRRGSGVSLQAPGLGMRLHHHIMWRCEGPALYIVTPCLGKVAILSLHNHHRQTHLKSTCIYLDAPTYQRLQSWEKFTDLWLVPVKSGLRPQRYGVIVNNTTLRLC